MAVLNPYNYKKPANAVTMRPTEKSIPKDNGKGAGAKTQQDSYLEHKVMSAKPHELTFMLYEGLVRFIKTAQLQNAQNNIEKTSEALLRAQAIIVELQSTLNMDYEVSNQLDALYDFMYERLVEANLKKVDSPMAEALEIAEQMRDTWKEAMALV